MTTKSFFQFFAMTALVVSSSTAFAQLGQLGGGTNATGGGGAGGATGSATAAALGAGQATGTTQGLGGITTQGTPGGDQTGGTAGGNIAEAFVGGNNSGAFVGGGIQTQQNSNRQFRAVTTTDVPTGGNTQGSGTPRRVPVSLKIGFAYPQPQATSLFAGSAVNVVQNVALRRPELRNVTVNMAAGGVATLTGFAPDADSRRLAGNLLRLNPGVRQVDNRLLISAEQGQGP
ncbi:MAG: BON domain-containing protein [Planctomycetaceae bacterium]